MNKRSCAVTCLVPLAAGLAEACGPDGGGQRPVETVDTTPYAREKLLDPGTCNQCHQDHFREWSGSMHAYASIDPVFRAMNARGQKETNGALGTFCVSCHAPMAVNEHATDGTDIESVPQQLQGVTCYFCHNVTSVAGTHNNPLVLANDVTMRGGIIAPMKYQGHRAEYSTLFDDDVARAGFQSSNLCGSCHDIVVPAHFSGATEDVQLERTFSEWKESVFAIEGNNKNNVVLNCTSGGTCHMAREKNVPIASPNTSHPPMPTRVARHLHDFPAIDTALIADFAESDADGSRDDQLAKIRQLLSEEFRVQICADRPQGSTFSIAVTVENFSAGHNFPSGASQDRRLWVELHAYKKGKELTFPGVLPSGVVPEGVAATSVEGTWVLYDQAFKVDGKTAHMFWDVASVRFGSIPVATVTKREGMVNEIVQAKEPDRIIEPDRITVTLWLEPIGLEVIDDLIQSNFLDASFRSRIPRYPIALVGQPSVDSTGRPVSFEWTLENAFPKANYDVDNRLCDENTPSRFAVSVPP